LPSAQPASSGTAISFSSWDRGHSLEIEALIDTGFDGHPTLPPGDPGFGPPDDYQRWTLADGSEV
jgi:hypothetical protein